MKKIKTYILHLWGNQFLRGSLVVLVASNIANLTQFIFHFLTGRFLGKVYYGDLAVMISILGIVAIIHSALGLTVVKLIASENEKKVSSFIKWINFYSLWLAVITTLTFLLFAGFISNFLNISQSISTYFLVPLVLFFIIVTTQRSMLQGLLEFNKYSLSFVIESVIKIFFVVVLLLIGWGIFGALTAMLLGIIGAFVVTRMSLSFHLDERKSGKKENKPALKSFLRYSSVVFAQGLALTSMYSADLILVKHFFSPEKAGIYSSLAILGRIVFFGANPIVNVMFPIISKRHSLNQKYYSIFYLSLLILLVIAVSITAIYYLIPQLPISVLYGETYLEGAPYLWWYGLFMTLLALAMLLTQFYLSINKTRIVYLFPILAVMQIILIWLYHQSLLQVIQMSILSAALLDILLLVYFLYQRKKL